MYTTPDLVRAQPETSFKNELTPRIQFVFRRHRYISLKVLNNNVVENLMFSNDSSIILSGDVNSP